MTKRAPALLLLIVTISVSYLEVCLSPLRFISFQTSSSPRPEMLYQTEPSHLFFSKISILHTWNISSATNGTISSPGFTKGDDSWLTFDWWFYHRLHVSFCKRHQHI